jgi:tetratricopeptide (TPR) repeat protein
MGELKAALEEALGGHGRLLMLVGEPGIGKTRTALELATYAGLRRAQVLWGRCYESHGMPPYWPWVQAIRAYVREREPEQLRAEMGSGAAEIAQIVSEVRQRLPDLQPAPLIEDPEAARFRLFDSLTTFLKSAAKGQPLVLILDDLHWADKPSLLLLQFLAGELATSRLLVVGAYRDVELSRKHPLAQALGELARERAFQRVLLRGLTQEDVGRFIELTSGLKPPQGLVRAVQAQTEGNPLFVNEVVRLLVQEGELTPERIKERGSWSLRIPEGVREVIGRRLDRLSERCNNVLTVASVIGREFSFQQLAKVGAYGDTPLSEEQLLAALEEGTAARVIEELPRAVGRYQFTHGLIQETLSEELSLTRRVRLHGRIAGVLEELYGAQADAHAAELAYHYGEAEAVLGPGKLVHYSLLAGEKALASCAWEEALTQFQRGLAAREGQPMDVETAALLVGLGRAQWSLGEFEESWASLYPAFCYYEKTADGAGVAVTMDWLRWTPSASEYRELMRRALRLVPADSHEAAHVISMSALPSYFEDADYEAARRAFGRALEIARREGDTFLEMWTLERASHVARMHLCWQEALDLALSAISLAGSANNLAAEVTAHYHVVCELLRRGDLERARQHAAKALQVAERLRQQNRLFFALSASHRVAEAQGDFPAARGFLERSPIAPPLDLGALAGSALLEANVSGPEQARIYLERLVERLAELGGRTFGTFPVALYFEAIPLAARTAGLVEHLQFAETCARAALALPNPVPCGVLLSRVTLGLIAVEHEDAEDARVQYQALQPHAGMASPGSGILLDRLLGLLAGTLGELDRAGEHFEQALAFSRKAGYRPELAWACCDYADLLLKRNGPGDQGKAIALLDESLAIAQELGMRPLMERALSRRKILKT